MKQYDQLIFLIFSAIFIVAIFHYCARLSIQKIYNEALYMGSHAMEKIKNLTAKVKEQILSGQSKMKKTRLVIAGCLRDRAEHVPKIKEMTERMGSLAKDYKILIVENDSTDDTRKLLLDWAKKNKNVEVLGCGSINGEKCELKLSRTYQWDVTHARMSKMRLIREIYLNRVQEAYSDWDVLLVWDYDLDGHLYEEGVAHALDVLTSRENIAGVAAYGYYSLPIGEFYYDPFAYVPQEDGRLKLNNLKSDDVIDCKSAFAGAALYKISAATKSTYNTDSSEDPLECEHITFSRKLQGEMVVDGAMIFPVLENPRYI